MKYKTHLFFGLFFLAVGANAFFFASGPSNKNEFAITFDDGPGKKITEQMLELLKKRNVKATFFLLGENVKKYPQIALKIKQEGHLLGNHTHSHKNLFALDKKSGKEEILSEEIDTAEKEILKAAGEKTKFLRFPNGFSKKWALDMAQKKGYITVNWTYGSDWTKSKEDKMTEDYLKALKPGAILLLHDGGVNKEKNLLIVEKILIEAEKKGLKPVRLDEMFNKAK